MRKHYEYIVERVYIKYFTFLSHCTIQVLFFVYNMSHDSLHAHLPIPFIPIKFHNKRYNIPYIKKIFLITCIPKYHSEILMLEAFQRKMLLSFSEKSTLDNSDVFQKKKWLRISDSKWSKLINNFECFFIDIIRRENAFDFNCLFRKIFNVMNRGDLTPNCLFERGNFRAFYSESSGLTMPAISDKEFSTMIEKFDQIAPFRRTT